jgi:K+/H+ antiporter YhaU regulatory subunit KhtT
VAIRKPDGAMVFNPESQILMGAGDVLITLGHRDQVDRMEKLAGA